MGDTYDYEPDPDYYGAPRSEAPYCRFCKSQDVRWVNNGVRWRLYDLGEQTLHSCGKVATPDDFDIC